MDTSIANKIQEKYTANNPRKESDSINYFFDKVFIGTKAEVIMLVHNPYANLTYEGKKEVLRCLDRSLNQLYISTKYYKHHLGLLGIEKEDEELLDVYY